MFANCFSTKIELIRINACGGNLKVDSLISMTSVCVFVYLAKEKKLNKLLCCWLVPRNRDFSGCQIYKRELKYFFELHFFFEWIFEMKLFVEGIFIFGILYPMVGVFCIDYDFVLVNLTNYTVSIHYGINDDVSSEYTLPTFISVYDESSEPSYQYVPGRQHNIIYLISS